LIAGELSSTVGRVSRISAPLFLVQGDLSGYYLAGGSDRNGQSNTLGQRTYEVTDNLSWRTGGHELTLGAHAESFRVADQNFSGSWGIWTFPSVAALESGTPTRYEIALPLRPEGPIARFHAREYAVYAQDRWEVSPLLDVTGGMRIDIPYNTAPATNPVLAADAALGRVNTAYFPSGNPIVAPRLALSWLIDENSNTRLRLGAGVFTARPPYVWLGSAFMNTGLDQATLICTAQDGGVPVPVSDPALAPRRCLDAAPGAPPPAIAYFSPGFRFPSTRKFLAGIDRELGASWSGSVDVIHTRGIDSPYLSDENLRLLDTDSEGRAMYGTLSPISSTGSGRPTRLDSTAFREAFHYGNRSGDWSTAVSIDIAGHWHNGSRLQLGYQWSRARDVISMANPGVSLTFQNAPIDGTIENRRLTTSSFDAPHSFTVTGIVPTRAGMTLAVAARAQSGQPFSYVADGDANADGVVSNDLLYVPRSVADVSLTNPELYPALNAYIDGEPCLARQRGGLAARNSCRNPWFMSLDTRLIKTVALPRSSAIDFSIDVFNLPNLLNGSWGLVRQTAVRQLPLLRVAGWDVAANRPRYAIPTISGTAVLPARNRVLLNESRWRIQIGARLRFGEPVRRATAPTSEPTR